MGGLGWGTLDPEEAGEGPRQITEATLVCVRKDQVSFSEDPSGPGWGNGLWDGAGGREGG